jgi:hypothetical protein
MLQREPMALRNIVLIGPVAAALVAAASHALVACGGQQTNNLAPPPRPPDPAQITLPPIRLTRASWSPTAPAAAAVTPAPTGRRGRAPVGPSLSAELATSVLTSANEPVRACYKGLLAFSPQAAGSVTTLMRVNPDGSVSDVEPIGNTDPSLLIMMPCVLNAVRTRRFPPTRGGGMLSFPFAFRSGEVGATNGGIGAPVEMTRPRPGEIQVVNPDPISVRPWRPTLVPNTNPVRALTRDMAAEAAPDITSLVDTCYSAAMVMIPGLTGQFGFRIAIEPSGNVSRVEVQDQGLLQGPLRDCLLALGGRLKFHSSGGGALVSVDVSLAQTEGPAPGAMTPGAMTPGAPLMTPGVPGSPAVIGTPTPIGGGALMPVPTR